MAVRTGRSAAISLEWAGAFAVRAAISIALCGFASACSTGSNTNAGFDEVSEQDRLTVEVATTRQSNISYQITSVATSENALDLCFEMCNWSSESCYLSNNVCNISKRYPKVKALQARCDVTRERCRVYRTKVPRQCPCDAQ